MPKEVTIERLKVYGVFSDETLRAVEKAAHAQVQSKTYQEYFDSLGIPKPHLFVGAKGYGVPVVDIPSRLKATQGTIVIHLPMANPLDENQLFHIATVASTLPGYRIIGFGNPSGKPYKYSAQNSKSLRRFISIAFTKNRFPLVRPEIEYLRQQKITNAHHVGYSYGAHKAVIEAGYLNGSEVASLTLIDPVAHTRGVRQLIKDFRSTFEPLGGYVNRTKMQIFLDARLDTAKTNHPTTALRRPVSVAIGILLARLDIVAEIKKLLSSKSRIKITIAWATKSELGNDAHMTAIAQALMNRYKNRVIQLRLIGDYHAFANDVHLYAAIIHRAVK